MPRKILVTSALPYANGALHLGHIIEAVQTDIWVRFQRMQGHDCIYVCAEDTHGTPVMIKAQSEGVTPEALITSECGGSAPNPWKGIISGETPGMERMGAGEMAMTPATGTTEATRRAIAPPSEWPARIVFSGSSSPRAMSSRMRFWLHCSERS